MATIIPSNATNQTVVWTSSNNAIATVDATGKVNAIAAGSATVTITTEDGGKTAICAVTVSAISIPVTSVSLNKTSLSLTEGGNETLTATVLPSNATNKNVTWSSSNSAIATVDNNGKVTALAAGTAIITATTQDGGFTATCNITVEKVERPHKYLDYSISGNTVKVWVVGAETGENYTLQVDKKNSQWEFTIEDNKMYHLRASGGNTILEAWVKK
jgi:uncharacterized protein YjdB